MALFAPRRRWLTGTRSGAYRRDADALADRHRWSGVWRAAAEGAGLSRTVNVAAGQTIITPDLVAVAGGPPLALVVRLMPGQLTADVTAVADRLAPALGAARVRVVGLSDGVHVRLELLDVDPLEQPRHRDPHAPAGLIGYGEDGDPLAIPWPRRGHALVQGQTGSGKSVWTYGQLADAATDPAVLVTGLDPSALLWRPFTGTRHAEWQVGGVGGDLAAHVALLERLVATMDDRIGAMPPDRDAVVTGPDLPVLLVVLEEYAGLLRVADVTDKKIGARVRALVARLLSEGRKAGVRVLIVVQRADAAVVDGLVRAQCALRVSFSVDSGEAVRMLHPAADDVAGVLAAPPGVALVTRPGEALARFRAPLLEYGAYCALVAGGAR